MPRSYTNNEEAREKKIIHAPWWSEEMTVDGRHGSQRATEEQGGIWVERAVIYANLLRIDEEAVDKRIFGVMQAPKAGQRTVDTSSTAKRPTYMIQQMVIELTDDEGNPAPMLSVVGKRPMLSEAFIKGMKQRDTEFLAQEITGTAEEPVPVTPADEAEAERHNQFRADMLAANHGHVHAIPPMYREERTGEGQAQESFRHARPDAVYGEDPA